MIHPYRFIRSLFSKDFVRRDLYGLLSAAPQSIRIEDHVEWLESLLDWIKLPVEVADENQKGSIRLTRLKFLIQFLDRQPELCAHVSRSLRLILMHSHATDLFCETGLNQEYGFVRELVDRVLGRFALRYSDPNDLSELFSKVFQSMDDAEWIETIDPALWDKLTNLFLPDESDRHVFRERFREALADALVILANRLCMISSMPEMRARLQISALADSPFFQLNAFLISHRDQFVQNSISATEAHKIIEMLEESDGLLQHVYRVLEAAGVSVELVYNIERGRANITRIRQLSQFLTSVNSEGVAAEMVRALLAELIRSHFAGLNITSLLGRNLNLISKKIVERAGVTGEHYIARTKEEYRAMFFSGGGGGALTTLTTAIKIIIARARLPLFFEGFFAWINYSSSFIAMQFMHLTLATKTPAATAATLAGRLKNHSSDQDLEFMNEVKALSRSAFAAVLGNVGVVIPGVFLFDFLFRFLTGNSFIDQEYALYQLQAHHPFESLTILYAIQTGGLLWFGSILGGWIENAFVYQRIAEVISKGRRARFIFGDEGAASVAQWLGRNISGLGTNLALGFLLGFATIFGKFFGAPFDVRHITLSSGSVAFSISALSDLSTHSASIVWAAVGLFIIGTLNFSISFSLSLFVASRARQIDLRQFSNLLLMVGREFLRRPLAFLFPQKGTP